MRRLPIFLVLDVSESMAGDNLRQVSQGLDILVNSLRQDPHALETVYLSLIVFAGKTKVLTPLVDLISYYSPRLPVGSGTSIGTALTTLMNEMDRVLIKTTFSVKGDWKPIIYLFTDGKPTDNVTSAVNRWKTSYASKANLVAIGIGSFAAMGTLAELTPHVFQLKNDSEQDFRKFIKWMTQSVKSQSQSVSTQDSVGLTLASIDESILTKIHDIAQAVTLDEDFVILTAKCEKTKLPYIMRYERIQNKRIESNNTNIANTSYQLNGVFPLEADYFSLSDDRVNAQTISSNALIGAPGCPHCGAPYGFSLCNCGGIHCLSSEKATCPWCNSVAIYTAGDGGVEVNRSRG